MSANRPIRPVYDSAAGAAPAAVPNPVPNVSGSIDDPYDFIGVGFGPSNLALAVAADEIAPDRSCLFFERNTTMRWHPGMLIPGARMQISYLKDLVSLRNLGSPYTFLRYEEANNRLERFVNLNEFRPTRLEYQDYLEWVAEAFTDRVRFGAGVTAVTPVRRPGEREKGLYRVTVEDVGTGQVGVHHAANVVYAAGGRPRMPENLPDSPLILHSSRFLPNFLERFPDRSAPYEIAVVGDGQSAGEIVAHLLTHYPRTTVHMFVSGFAPRATDNNPFANEQFYEARARDTYDQGSRYADAMRAGLRTTNYGAIEGAFLDDLYRLDYADEVRGARRLIFHPFSRVGAVTVLDDGLEAVVGDRTGGPDTTARCDGMVLATGYVRDLDPTVFGPVRPLLDAGPDEAPAVSADHRVRTAPGVTAGLYVQGYAESCFGLGDTLLSLLPFRAQQIVTDIGRHTPHRRHRRAAAYPPAIHVEDDAEKIEDIVRRYNFATVISALDAGDAVVTHVPLTFDPGRGEHGVLFGHMDRNNPHAGLIDDRRVTVVFHGPSAYISPHRLDGNPLPTWNSMNVHVTGIGRQLRDRRSIVAGMRGICSQSDPDHDAYRLDPDDPRIARLIHHVVAFEIDIIEVAGRFKVSQELDGEGQRRVVSEMNSAQRRRRQEMLDECLEVQSAI